MKDEKKTWVGIISVAIVVYALGMLIWLGMWFVIGDGVWWLMLIHRAVPFLAISIIVVRCSRWLWFILGIPLFVFGGFYYPYLAGCRRETLYIPFLW
jgi:hypothetical protein